MSCQLYVSSGNHQPVKSLCTRYRSKQPRQWCCILTVLYHQISIAENSADVHTENATCCHLRISSLTLQDGAMYTANVVDIGSATPSAATASHSVTYHKPVDPWLLEAAVPELRVYVPCEDYHACATANPGRGLLRVCPPGTPSCAHTTPSALQVPLHRGRVVVSVAGAWPPMLERCNVQVSALDSNMSGSVQSRWLLNLSAVRDEAGSHLAASRAMFSLPLTSPDGLRLPVVGSLRLQLNCHGNLSVVVAMPYTLQLPPVCVVNVSGLVVDGKNRQTAELLLSCRDRCSCVEFELTYRVATLRQRNLLDSWD